MPAWSLNQIITSIFIMAGFVAAASLAYLAMKKVVAKLVSKTKTNLDNLLLQALIPILKKVTLLLAVFLGTIWILDIIGVDLPWLRSWLIQHGTRMGLIAILSLVLIFLLSRLIPAAVKPVVIQKTKDDPAWAPVL